MRERQKRGDAKRAEIMETARSEFMSSGYNATSMSTIAAKVGGSKGTLYNHFRSKEELFSAIICEDCSNTLETMFDIVANAPTVDSALRELGKALVAKLLSPESLTLLWLIAAESQRFPELGHTFYDSGPREGAKRIANTLKAAMERGELREADPEIAAAHFKALCIGDLHMRHLLGVAQDTSAGFISDRVDTAVDVFMRAYGPDKD